MKLLVAGSNGLIGSALKETLAIDNRGYDIVCINRQDADLTKEEEVKAVFEKHQPDLVINTAASVGGILGNATNHASYFLNNTLISAFMIHYCHVYGVEKMLNMSSTCIFPKECESFNETQMHDGAPFEAHYAYAYSKRMIDVQCKAYDSQYGRKNYSCVIPGNVFGPHDRFDIVSGHVIPCLLLKFFLASRKNKAVEIWGDGTPQREFIYSYDLANIMLDILDLDDIPRNILVCSDVELTIKSLVEIIAEEIGFKNEIVWNKEKPNGQMRKRSDTSLLQKLLPGLSFTDFRYAIKDTYQWMESNYPNIRLQ